MPKPQGPATLCPIILLNALLRMGMLQLLHSGIAELIIVQAQHLPKYGSQKSNTVLHSNDDERDNTMAFATDTGFATTSLGNRFAAFRAQLADNAAKRKIYRQTVSELEALSARDLADLGIDRGLIKPIAMEAAYGK